MSKKNITNHKPIKNIKSYSIKTFGCAKVNRLMARINSEQTSLY